MGFLGKDFIRRLLRLNLGWKTAIIVVVLVVEVSLALHNGRPSWLQNSFGDSIIVFYITSLAGATFLFMFTSLMEKLPLKVIKYLSINTITILGIHLQLFRFLPKTDAFVGAAIVLAYCLPIIWLLNKACPTLIGNKKK